jgi:hypothetical protein
MIFVDFPQVFSFEDDDSTTTKKTNDSSERDLQYYERKKGRERWERTDTIPERETVEGRENITKSTTTPLLLLSEPTLLEERLDDFAGPDGEDTVAGYERGKRRVSTTE